MEPMTGTTHTADARCPDCGGSEAIMRVRGNAISGVCSRCRRVDVGPLLDGDDLARVTPDDLDADVFELEAVRSGQAGPLSIRESILRAAALVELQTFEPTLQVELRMPVPPR